MTCLVIYSLSFSLSSLSLLSLLYWLVSECKKLMLYLLNDFDPMRPGSFALPISTLQIQNHYNALKNTMQTITLDELIHFYLTLNCFLSHYFQFGLLSLCPLLLFGSFPTIVSSNFKVIFHT